MDVLSVVVIVFLIQQNTQLLEKVALDHLRGAENFWREILFALGSLSLVKRVVDVTCSFSFAKLFVSVQMQAQPVIIEAQTIVFLHEVLIEESDQVDILLIIFDQNNHIFVDLLPLVPHLIFVFNFLNIFVLFGYFFEFFLNSLIHIFSSIF